MKKIVFVGCAIAVAAVLSGCGANNLDLEGVPFVEPDKMEVVLNVNDQPNIGRVCIDGTAWITTSREFTSIVRVPEWDEWCGSGQR